MIVVEFLPTRLFSELIPDSLRGMLLLKQRNACHSVNVNSPGIPSTQRYRAKRSNPRLSFLLGKSLAMQTFEVMKLMPGYYFLDGKISQKCAHAQSRFNIEVYTESYTLATLL